MTSLRVGVVLALCAAIALAAFLLLRPRDTTPLTAPGVEREERASREAETLRLPDAPGGRETSSMAGDAASARPLRGTTVPTQVRGVVVGAEGVEEAPIAGATVSIHAVDAQSLARGLSTPDGPALGTATTERDGSFAIDASQSGWLRVVAAAAGRATGAALAPGAGAFVVVRLGAAGSLVVEVADEEGKPVTGASVEVSSRDVLHLATTGEDGRARLESLGVGSAAVRAWKEGSAETRVPGVVVEPGVAGEVLVVLRPATRIEGRVVDAAGGQPIAGAEVHVAWPGRAVPAGPTAADGSFGPVAAGPSGERVFLAARAEGYAPALEPVVAGAPGPEPLHVEVRLSRSEPWAGRVVDEQGNPIEGASVTYTPDGVAGRAQPTATTDGEGRFTLPPPPPPAPGRRILVTASRGGAMGAWALRPEDRRPESLVIVLSLGATVGGRIVERDGRPVSGARVRLQPDWGERDTLARPDANTARLLAVVARGLVGLDVTTDEDGTWQIRGLPDGEYRMQVDARGAPRWIAETVRVSGGASVDVGVITLGTGLRLDGRVVADDGRPLPGARITLAPDADARRTLSATSRADGRFELLDLTPGPYGAHVARAGYEAVRLPVDLAESRTVEVTLPTAARLEIQVQEAGAPYDGLATVALERTDRPSAGDVVRTLRASGGKAVLEGAPAGSWTVQVEAAGGRVGRTRVPVEVSSGRVSGVAVEIAAGAVLEGSVVGPSGAGVAGATVGLRRDGMARRSATTDASGRYRIEGIAAGTFEMRTSGPGGAPDLREVSLAAGERTRVDVVLGEGARLVVEVVDAKGRPQKGVLVLAASRQVAPASSPPRTGDDGRVTLEHLPAGDLVLRARADDGRTARGRASVGAGSSDVVVLTLETASTSRAPSR